MITSPYGTSSTRVATRPAGRRGRVLRLVSASLFLGAVAAIGASSCTETEGTFYISEAVTSTAAIDATTGLLTITCGSDPSPVAQVWASVCDGNVGGAIFACFGLRSELVASTSPASIEARSIVVKSATTTLTGAEGSGTSEFANSAILDPQAPGASPVEVVVPIYFGKSADMATYLAAGSAQGSLILHGRTTGNIDLDTPRFDFEAVFQGVPCTKN